jgi:hypothetical protein
VTWTWTKGSLSALSSFRENSRVSVEGEMFTPRDIQAGVPQGSILSPQTPGVYLGLFADDSCIHAKDHKEGYEDKTQEIYFSHTLRPPEAHLKLNGQNIPFANHVNI